MIDRRYEPPAAIQKIPFYDIIANKLAEKFRRQTYSAIFFVFRHRRLQNLVGKTI